MEIRQLEYFAAVARHRHFTRAADELYVTQSALSQQVRRLEDELGIALLLRTSRGVELTPTGADLLFAQGQMPAGRATVPGLSDRRARLLQEEQDLSDHAYDRYPPKPGTRCAGWGVTRIGPAG